MGYYLLNAQIDELLISTVRPIILAIDGDCAAGKSTLAVHLAKTYAATVIPMDAFFLRPEQRTAARLAEPGGNIDYERFKTEVLIPLVANKPFTYRPYDCQTADFAPEITILPNRLHIIEGTYSLHPTLVDAYHLKLFLGISSDEQLCRIAARNGDAMLERFRDEWIPMEKCYFSHFGIKKQCDFVFEI